MTIIGKNVDLREVEVNDAAFILSLRLDQDLNQHISKVENDLTKQEDWIKQYKLNNQEYYFIIQNKKKEPVGTVRIYDIKEDRFCWGSWIVKPEARLYASFESAVLLYQYAFFNLGFNHTFFDVRKENQKVINFHLRFGAIQVDENDQDIFMIFKKEDFINKHHEYLSTIDRISERYKK
jgi:RimJ/RimL family protein N-acetyltransferase